MAESWPSNIPQKPLQEGFTEELGETRIRTDMEVGPAKVRSRFTNSIDNYRLTFEMTYSEYAVFKSFYKNTLINGTLSFNQDNPVTGDSSEFRFVGTPSQVPSGGIYTKVSMTWEELP